MNTLYRPSRTIPYARRYTHWGYGLCLQYVGTMLTLGKNLGVYAPYALHAWEHTHHKHHGTPPPGVPVYFDHSSHNHYGHIALSVGHGRIRTTDGTRVHEMAISTLARNWGQRYLGWGSDMYGHTIPGISSTTSHPVLKRGSRGSAVKTLQSKLNHHGMHLHVDGIFGAGTEHAVKVFQRSKHLTVDGIVGRNTWRALG